MSSLYIFRKVAVAEGVSYLLLLFVAMPIKYIAGILEPVKYVGWIHGGLFVAYSICFLMAWIETKWKFGKAALIFFASLLPFAPFFVDRKLKSDSSLSGTE